MNVGRLGLLSVGLIFGLSACDIISPGGGPAITSFSATPPTIANAGDSAVLAWSVDSSATTISISPGVGNVTSDTDDRVTVNPTATTTYTLTATNASSRSTTRTATVTVANGTNTGGNNPPPPPPPPGDGSFGVSTSATGPFSNDLDGPISSDTDPRIISVAAGTTFYAEVEFTDPDGIEEVAIVLVNSSPPGLYDVLPQGGFALTGQNTGQCTTGGTTISCVYAISVAPGTPDIASLPGAGDEFAYVFRPRVTDTAGNLFLAPIRGYVNITP